MLRTAQLIESGFDISTLPGDVRHSIDMLQKSTRGTWETDSQPLHVLDKTIIDTISVLHPGDARVTSLLVDQAMEITDAHNDGFNAVVDNKEQQFADGGKTIGEGHGRMPFRSGKNNKLVKAIYLKRISVWVGIFGPPYLYDLSYKPGTPQASVDEAKKFALSVMEKLDAGQFSDGGQLSLFDKVEKEKITPEMVAARATADREKEPNPQLTLLSFGGGQDSFAILYSMINDKAFRKKYAPNDLVVAMSDTGNEFPYTYKAIKEAQALCKKNNIPFHFITPDQGYHTPGWQNLKANLKRNRVILGAAMGSKACTISLKINVIDKFLHAYMCELYSIPQKQNKQSWQLYADKFGTKARILIGFAKDEEVRVIRSNKLHEFLPLWKRKNIQYVYPLIEEGWNRAIAQQVIGKYRSDIPPPSNCMICFYQSDQELLWLARNYPDEFAEWVEMERVKLERFEGTVPKNYGVYGAITLTQKLEKAKQKYGHMSNEELWEYKMSHGHCVKSAY